MYSQPWLPMPSTTAVAPELRTQNRSPTVPRMKISPLVAPNPMTLPAMVSVAASAVGGADFEGLTTIRPPESPFPTKSLASPSRMSSTPAGTKAPKELPAEPVSSTLSEPSSSPLAPVARVTSWPRRVPVDRSTLEIG